MKGARRWTTPLPLVLAVATMLAAPSATALPWLQPRGDAAATGFQPESGPAWPDVALEVELPKPYTPTNAHPLILDDRVLFLAAPHEMRERDVAPMDLTEEEQRIFSAGVEVITAPTAQALAKSMDWSDRKRVLDIGGGTGSTLRAILSQNEHLQGTLFDLPDVAEIAKSKLRGLDNRVDVVAGDVFQDPLPGGHDAILMANVMHLWQPEKDRQVLARIADVAEPGALLLLADFWTDADKIDPPMAALASGDLLLAMGESDVYSVEEVAAWLDHAGFHFIEHQPLAGPQSLIVAEVR